MGTRTRDACSGDSPQMGVVASPKYQARDMRRPNEALGTAMKLTLGPELSGVLSLSFSNICFFSLVLTLYFVLVSALV